MKSPNLQWILNKVSLGAAAFALGLALAGWHDEAGFLLLMAIYIDGRLFLIK